MRRQIERGISANEKPMHALLRALPRSGRSAAAKRWFSEGEPTSIEPHSRKRALNDKIDRIYMEKESREGDTRVQQKLSWKMKHYFYIITEKIPVSGPSSTTVEKVIWDPQDFSDE